MSEPLRVALATYGPEQFRLLHTACEDAGHIPVGYLVSRALRSGGRSESGDVEAVSRILESLPPGMDLLLPGTGRGVARALAGYRPDLVVAFGFNWRLPPEVLALPRFGVLNVHPSALPRYRGPAPLLWAIRNGDPTIGVTVHRMDDGLDTGPILAQRDDVPLPEHATPGTVWEQTGPVVAELVQVALDRVVAGDPGVPQDEARASYAGFAPQDWQTIDWTDERHRIHHQIRVLRYMSGGTGPVVELKNARVRVRSTSLDGADGVRVECGDGPLWVTSWEPVEGPVVR
jgi:methionyl-tRNA formyltransferase